LSKRRYRNLNKVDSIFLSKELWQAIDKLTGKEQTKSGIIELKINDENHHRQIVSNHFNDYFIDSVNEIIQDASGLSPCLLPQPPVSDHEALCFKSIDGSKKG